MITEPEDPVLEAAVNQALRLVATTASPALLGELRKTIRLSLAMDPRAQALVQRLRGRSVRIHSGSSPTGNEIQNDESKEKTGE
jgi:hypothetical protein